MLGMFNGVVRRRPRAQMGPLMPRQTREQRQAARAAAGARFSAWVAPRMKALGLGPTEVVRRVAEFGITLDKGSVSHWVAGDYPPEPEGAAYLARVLNEDPVEAMREAGHDALVDALLGRDPVLMMLESVGRPDLTDAMAKEYLEGLEAVRARTREMADQVKRDQEAANG